MIPNPRCRESISIDDTPTTPALWQDKDAEPAGSTGLMVMEPRKFRSLTCENEVRAAAVAGDRDHVGEQSPEGLDDPRRVRDALVELGRRRLHALHVLPVVPRGDAADGVADALAGAIDRDDGEHEAPVQLVGQPLQSSAGGGDADFANDDAAAGGGGFLEAEGAVFQGLHLGRLRGRGSSEDPPQSAQE